MTTLRQLPDGTERPLLFQLSLWQSGKMALIRQDTGSKKKAVSLPWMSDHIDTVDYGTPVVRTSARICTTLTCTQLRSQERRQVGAKSWE